MSDSQGVKFNDSGSFLGLWTDFDSTVNLIRAKMILDLCHFPGFKLCDLKKEKKRKMLHIVLVNILYCTTWLRACYNDHNP